MNMLSRMDRHICIYLLIISCFTIICIDGSRQDVSSSCEVSVNVRRHILRSAPNQSLTIICPVTHCGESLNVTWCKLDKDQCERLNYSENVKIRQNKHGDKLFARLIFERISIHDDGLYRCGINGYELVSHWINVSVSDSHQGFQNSQNVADAVSSPAADVDASWQPYFFIVFGVGLLVAAMTGLTLLRIHGWRRTLMVNQTKAKEMPSHNIPDLPKARAPSLPVPPSNVYSLNENFSHTKVQPTPQPPLMTSVTQFTVINPEDPNQGSHRVVYASINRQAMREQRKQTTGNEENAYAAIRMS